MSRPTNQTLSNISLRKESEIIQHHHVHNNTSNMMSDIENEHCTMTQDDMTANDLTQRFVNFYNDLSYDNIDTLGNLYTDDIVFIDPLHEMRNLHELKSYFRALYSSVDSIHFEMNETVVSDEKSTVFWTMHLQTPKLNNGKGTTLSGSTLLKFRNNRIFFHRDYYDMGEMIYEHIPLLGKVIQFIKKRLTS